MIVNCTHWLLALLTIKQDHTMKYLHSLLSSNAGMAALILRVPVGLILAAHGAQKYLLGLAATALKALGSGWQALALSLAIGLQ